MQKKILSFFICLFAWGCLSHSKMFHSYEDVTITGERLQILTYTRDLQLSSEGFPACHTFWDTEHPFIMVISRNCDTHTCCRAFNWVVELSLPVSTILLYRCWNSPSKPSACKANDLIDCATVIKLQNLKLF